MHRFLPLLLGAALLPWVGLARGAEIGVAIRAADWPSAQALAAGSPDPLAAKLVTFLRLLHPGGAGASEIAAFAAANPQWPDRPLLGKRRDEALAGEPDDATALLLCATPTSPGPALPPPNAGSALARCAEAAAAAGEAGPAADAARAAWVAGLPDRDAETRFLRRWARVLTSAEEARRFDSLIATDPAAAAAQLPRLAPADRALARVRLALRGGASDPGVLMAALPPAVRADPALVLDELRALRRAGRNAEALARWREAGFAAERQAGGSAFWAERAVLARQLLSAADDDGAYIVADDAAPGDPEAAADAAFLAGFIALRRLHRPDVAIAHFQQLARTSSAISQARAHYWLGRAAAARQDVAAAQSEFAAAAAWPTTYYGQLASLAIGNGASVNVRILALADPAWTSAEALEFTGRELVRAAATLVAWGLPGPARAFLQQAARDVDPRRLALQARFALDLGMPDQAVATARRAGRAGVVLIGAGWPLAAAPPAQPAPPALALAIIRQESSFDVGAVSPSGALGLMQLMPSTAALVGRQIGATVPVQALTSDPAANMRLGTAYLGQLIGRFGGSLPLAIAAYNAGPTRVAQWLAENGDPRGGGVEQMVDWVELIGFAETRNYVQRVIENVGVYRAKRGEILAYPVS